MTDDNPFEVILEKARELYLSIRSLGPQAECDHVTIEVTVETGRACLVNVGTETRLTYGIEAPVMVVTASGDVNRRLSAFNGDVRIEWPLKKRAVWPRGFEWTEE